MSENKNDYGKVIGARLQGKHLERYEMLCNYLRAKSGGKELSQSGYIKGIIELTVKLLTK